MPKKILLMCGEVEASHLADRLLAANSDISVRRIASRDDLDAAHRAGLADTRLISVMSDVLVPGDFLEALPGPAYNFHPGPPEYRGIFPSCFAIYNGETDFGITLHEMAPSVDSGPIVDVRRFPVPDDARYTSLELLSYKLVIALFFEYADRLAADDDPLPRSEEVWSGPARTKAQWRAMREPDPDLSEDEIARRVRAFG